MTEILSNSNEIVNANSNESQENFIPPKRLGVHHSFDADLAIELKNVELAVLVHHFQYWIRHNSELGRNFHEGKTWTYQTLKEITAYFPYWTQRQIEKFINKLVDHKILMKGNFNKSAYDRTVWYSFCDEERFSIGRNRQMLEGDRGISPNGEIENAKKGNGNPQKVTPIPDPITNTKTYIPPLMVPEEPVAPDGASPPAASSVKRKKNSFLPSEESKELAEEMVKEMEKVKPGFKKPSSLTNMAIEVEAMIQKEGRKIRAIFELFTWAIHDSFWRDKFFKPNPAKYLRDRFDQLEAKMTAPKPIEKRRFAPSSNSAEALKTLQKMNKYAL